MSETILVVTEDGQLRNTIGSVLRLEGYPVLEAENGSRALDLLRRQVDIALILTAIDLSDMKNVNFVTEVHAINTHVPIIVLVKSETENQLPVALQSGAIDFLAIPPSPLRLKITLETCLRHRNFKHEAYRVRRYAENHLKFKDLVAKSPKMQATIAQARKYVRHKANILLCGEEGCEHELFARIIHRENTARQGAFVAIQCFKRTSDDWHTILSAKLAQTHRGSLLLTHIDRLDASAQQHLLEHIQHLSNSDNLDVRFMATTNLDLNKLAIQGHFNPTLLSLFQEGRIDIAPLRERKQDIEELCHVILKVVVAETGRQQILTIGKRALTLLQHHDWPGNLAELESALFRSVFLSDGPILSVSDFPQIWRQQWLRGAVNAPDKSNLLSEQENQIFWDEFGHIRPLAEIEKLAIDAAWQRYGGSPSEVARRLHISRATLYRKIKTNEI